MQDDLNVPNLGDPEVAAGQLASRRGLRESDRVIAKTVAKPRIAWLLARPASPEERLKREVDLHGNVLQNLRMDRDE